VSASGAVDVWQRINGWMAPLEGAIDAVMRPLVSPLADQFDWVTGDSAEVSATAERWRDLARRTRALSDSELNEAFRTAAGWTGQASDAFERLARDFAEQIDAVAAEMDVTAEYLLDASLEVKMAEDLVETIIRELIEWALITLVVSAALAVVTFGASAAAGGAAAAAQAAVAGSRVASALAKLAKLLRAVADALKAVRAMKTLSREGILVKTILVKGMLIKPVVKGVTGLTGAPISESAESIIDGFADIAADEVDDQRRGDQGPQTPLRDRIDDPIRPVTDHLPPPGPVDDAIDRLRDRVPSAPGE
jgi:hypothetical protein